MSTPLRPVDPVTGKRIPTVTVIAGSIEARIVDAILTEPRTVEQVAALIAGDAEVSDGHRNEALRLLSLLDDAKWVGPLGGDVWGPRTKARSRAKERAQKSERQAVRAQRKAETGRARPENAPRAERVPEVPAVDRVRELMDQARTIEANGGIISDHTREALRMARVVHGAEDWRISVPAMFPGTCTKPFAPHQEDLMDWADKITEKTTPRPYCSAWPRGHAKSSLAEIITVLLAHRRVRRYCLYVSGKQTKADDHVASIGELLESAEIAAIDPDLSEREVNKYGSSKGWRRNRLTTKAGFTIDAVGLDSDVRGARIGTQRPDLIIFDDVDGSGDSPETIEKKIERITKDLIPTQDPDGVAIMFVQNVIHHRSIMARLAEIEGAPKIDMLTRRIVSGPIKAIVGLEFKEAYDPEYDRNRFIITAGVPTWIGYDIDACQHMIDNEGLTAFLSECQHEEGTLRGGMFDHINWQVRRRNRAELPALQDNGTWVGQCGTWVDPAVTATDRSDSCAVMTDGLAKDRKVWRLYSWEQVATPEEAMRHGLESAMRWGSQVLGVETDQGGLTWEVVYRTVVRAQLDDEESFTYQRHNTDRVPIPRYEERKAGAVEGSPSKRQRIAGMLARYDTDEFRHFDEGCVVLEAGLSRFPRYKPFDIADASWHSWRWLAEHGGEGGGRGFKARAARGAPVQGPRPR